MNREYCIFKTSKPCNNCGECDRCDLNSSKLCNNCGKCLEAQGFDMKAIKIDEIVDDDKESIEVEKELAKESNDVGSNENDYQLNKVDFYDEDNGESVILNQEYDDELSDDSYNDNWDENIEYIDDIEGLSEVLEDKDKFEDTIFEEYPGLIRFKK
ncbi:hypothetical protein [Clostridium sp. DJ247]|uniref:hypothetical protein n=1 Tax=Clostridium sp. DJ247 TaxID=2726188 RepID=UPI001629C8DB|nr:hypothetical protein [Clostridium sp. DJ247]MBC2581375.1 hypothetical protein [Clostridium sp. DJ247]